MKGIMNWTLFIVIFLPFIELSSAGKIKHREAFPSEHESYLPDAFKQQLKEIAKNEYLAAEARIDLIDKVYDKLPQTVLMKLPLDPPVYQLPPPTQKKFRALMIDRSLGWRRRAQLYDKLVESLPDNYKKLMDQYAKSGSKLTSESSSSESETNDRISNTELEAAGIGGVEQGPVDIPSGMGSSYGGDATGMGGTEMITDIDKSGIDYDKYTSSSSSSEEKGSKNKPWSSKAQINKKSRIG